MKRGADEQLAREKDVIQYRDSGEAYGENSRDSYCLRRGETLRVVVAIF